MRKAILVLLLILCITRLKAQSFEISVQANTGLSHYSGAGTLSSTFFNGNDDRTGYPNSSGNRGATICGTGIQWQYTFKSNFLLGLQTGYEALGSKVNLTSVGSPGRPATGSFTDHLNYINLNPYIGYSLKLSKISLDLMPGLDLAFGTSEKGTGKVTTNDGRIFTATNLGGKPKDDVRVKFGIAAYYQKFGITTSYSYGLTDFNSGALADAPVPSMHLEVVRIGLSYRIK